MLTLDDYFGRMSLAAGEEPSEEVRQNAAVLLERVNALLAELATIDAALHPVVNSGWRTSSYNAIVPNAAIRSRHITGEAIDLADPEGALDEYLFENQDRLAAHFLYMEHPASTKGWTHLQSTPPRSGNRVFFP